MPVYMPCLDVIFMDRSVHFERWLVTHGGIPDPPCRPEGYRVASDSLARRMSRAIYLHELAQESRS